MKKSENELKQAIKALMDYYGMPEYPQPEGNMYIGIPPKYPKNIEYPPLLSWWYNVPLQPSHTKYPITMIDMLYAILCGGLDYAFDHYKIGVELHDLRAERKKIREMAQLMKFLKSCGAGELTISVKSKACGNRKPKISKVILSSDMCFHYTLEKMVCSYLSGLLDDWGLGKKPFDVFPNYPNGESMQYHYLDPYSTEDLDEIIEATKSPRDKIRVDKNQNAMLGYFASMALEIIDPVTPNNFTKTKLYSFVYDIMAIGEIVVDRGEGFSGDIAREKLQDVRHWLDAFQELKKKF